jgi:two-component system, chemotaxis family, protein-glutamate methylesterase/glutaminase
MIKVLLVEDSPIALTLLTRIINSTVDLVVVGTAHTGLEGLNLIPQLKPDVICTDLHMPKMDGLQFTSEVMTNYPTPILVISASVQEEDTMNVFRLLEAGAVDIFPKPRAGLMQDYEDIKSELINKIRILSGVKVFRRSQSKFSSSSNQTIPQPQPQNQEPQNPISDTITPIQPPVIASASTPIKIIAIGSSTGGPQALLELLGNLPPHFPIPIICIQHISEGFLQGLLDWLSYNCSLSVRIAQYGETPQARVVYFPPEGHHLTFDTQGRFVTNTLPPIAGHRPSITVTLQAIAKTFGSRGVGILLTGMGRDGAEGLLALYQAGSLTIAQDEATSVVFGMPKEAIALGAARKILPIEAIAPFLLQKLGLNYSRN